MLSADGGEGNGRPISRAVKTLQRVTADVADETNLDALEDVSAAALELQLTTSARRRALLAARPADDEGPDEWLDIKALAKLINLSVSTIRHRPPDWIPGRRQHVTGGKVEWSKRKVEHWLATCSGG